MSRRQMKKVLGPPQIGPMYSSSEEEEPHCSYVNKKPNVYAELEVQASQSALKDGESFEATITDEDGQLSVATTNEDGEMFTTTTSEDDETSAVTTSYIKGTKRAKKKAKIGKKSKKSTSAKDDDIDQLVQEVNKMMGEPSPKEETVAEKKPEQNILSVRKIHLNASNEINRLFGPDDADGNRKKTTKQQPKDIVRNPITPLKTYPFKNMGLSMTALGNGDCFVYNHSSEYQMRHMNLISYFAEGNELRGPLIYESFANMHVEGMLELFRIYCEAQEYSKANVLLENLIGCLQFVAHPLFNLTNVNTRLEYKYVENRAFHIAILLYSYLLSNKACHRTALELAKMLLNLDPSDPLGVIFVIDTFAIRAREYTWLIEAINYWENKKDLKYLFNMKFSYALAHFHVLNNKKEDLKGADKLLKDALIMFPAGLVPILSSTKLPTSSRKTNIYHHKLYADHKRLIFPLRDVIKLYIALSGSRWAEPPVLEWLLRNAEELMGMFDSDLAVQKEVEVCKIWLKTIYRRWPLQVLRHFITIYPVSDLIADGLVPFMPVYHNTDYFNPLPVASATVNRCRYPARRYSLH